MSSREAVDTQEANMSAPGGMSEEEHRRFEELKLMVNQSVFTDMLHDAERGSRLLDKSTIYESLMKPMFYDNIRSDVLDDRQSMTSSTLASSPENFTRWASSVGLKLENRKTLQEVEGIKQRIRYPMKLNSLTEEDYALVDREGAFVKGIKAWVASDETIAWDTSSEEHLLWEALLDQWTFTKKAVEDDDYEASQRILTDSMMLVLFRRTSEDGIPYEIVVERDLALPRPESYKRIRPRVSSAKPDLHVMMAVPESPTVVMRAGQTPAYPSVSHCLKNWSEKRILLGVFPLENKHRPIFNSERRLAMNFASVQYHRRVLALSDKIVYGATVDKASFQLYASYRDGKILVVMPVSGCTWDLAEPKGFVQCLQFLNALKLHIDGSFRDDLAVFEGEKSTTHLQRIVDALEKKPNNWTWRDDYSRKRPVGGHDEANKRQRRGSGPVDDDYMDQSDLSCDIEDDEDNEDADEMLLRPFMPADPSGGLETGLKTLPSAPFTGPGIARWRSAVPPEGS